MRRFWRFHFFKVLLALVVIQLGIFAWLQYRNHRPEAIPDETSLIEGQSVIIRVLRNDTDKDKEELELGEVSDPPNGSIKKLDNEIEYTPDQNFFGVDSFLYTASDGKKASRETYVRINVKENLKPVANDDHVQVYSVKEIILPVLGNDTDPEGDSIFIHKCSEPVHGKVILHDNELVYRFSDKTARQDSFHYTIGDGLNLSDEALVTIIKKDMNNPCYPWMSLDIGVPGTPGELICLGNNLNLKTTGEDIWGEADKCHFAYQYMHGDGVIISKVNSMTNTHEYAKAGVMIWSSLYGGSKNANMVVTAKHGTTFQYRAENGAASKVNNQNDGLAPPCWVKLKRKGDTFTGFKSADGIKWTEVGKASIPMPKPVYIGIAASSHDKEKVCKVVFDKKSTRIIH